MEQSGKNMNFNVAMENDGQNGYNVEITEKIAGNDKLENSAGENGSYSNSEEWTRLGERILNTAKQELFFAMRYMFSPLNMFEYVRNQKIACVATDGKSIFYNPMKLALTYRDNPVLINRAYLHMVFHCLFKNIYGADNKDVEIWNLASDIMAEYLIDQIDLSCVMLSENSKRQKIYKRLEKECRIMSADNIYYSLLQFKKAERDEMIASDLFVVDDHFAWYEKDNKSDGGNKNDNSGDNTSNNNSGNNGASDRNSDNWDNAAKQLQSAMTMFGFGRGDSKGNLKKLLSAKSHNYVSYRDFLRKFATVRENMSIDDEAFDYGYYNYGMTVYKNMPLIEELEYKEERKIEDFVIVLDTSGSCAYELIQGFLNTTFDILKNTESFFDNARVHILQCDNEVRQDSVIKNVAELDSFLESFEVKGFGGTDFRPAFNYVNELLNQKKLERLKGLIYFTDGYGIYPSIKPVYEAAFVFLGEYDADRNVPGWAMRLDIQQSEFENYNSIGTAK